MGSVSQIRNPRTNAFWGELVPNDHSVQIYRDDDAS